MIEARRRQIEKMNKTEMDRTRKWEEQKSACRRCDEDGTTEPEVRQRQSNDDKDSRRRRGDDRIVR